MNISEVLLRVDQEKSFGSRFPVRMIFCNSLQEYRRLVHQLKSRCDNVLNLASYCSKEDTHPRFSKLKNDIAGAEGKQLLLLSVGEYLRLAVKRESALTESAQFCGFWQMMLPVGSATRVYVPVFDAFSLFERVVGNIDERQTEYIWTIDGEDEQCYSITVCSDSFKESFPAENCIIGFKNWLLLWENKLSDEPIVVTSRITDCEKSYGKVAISVIDNPYEYLAEADDAITAIDATVVSEEFWARLFSDYKKHNNLEKTILDALNFKTFDSTSVASLWDGLSEIHRWYVWLWYKLHSPEDYVGSIIAKLKPSELSNVAKHIANDILPYMESKPEWIAQRSGILNGLKGAVPTEDFFVELENYLPQTALKVMSCQTHEERRQIVKTVCRWLRNSNEDETVISEIVNATEKIYPAFSNYLITPKNLYGKFTDYFKWYKRKKIINRPVKEPLIHADLEVLSTRYSLLSEYDGKNCTALWIDGLGIEYLSLLANTLESQKNTLFEYSVNMAISRLPSETEYNKQWQDNELDYQKRDRLDKLSHSGMPDDKDYFSCIAQQIQVVSDLVQEAISLLNHNDFVIITGDHGSSRLAALAFHDLPDTLVPQNAKVFSHGRFCEISAPISDEDVPPFVYPCKLDNKDFLVMKDYNHYTQKGNAAGGNSDTNAVAGELHGGYTPEECIVPVIVLKNCGQYYNQKITHSFDSDTIISNGSKASLNIIFPQPIDSLEVTSTCGTCNSINVNNGTTWRIDFVDLDGFETELSLCVNGKLLNEKTKFKIITNGISSGMSEKWGDFF